MTFECFISFECFYYRLAWLVPAKNKTIIFDSGIEATYTLNLDQASAQIQHLTLTTNMSALSNGTKASQSVVTVKLEGNSRCFRTLTIINIKIMGEFSSNCSHEVSSVYRFDYVTVAMTSRLCLVSSNVLTFDMSNSFVDDCLVWLSSSEQSAITLTDSTFSAPLPRLSNDTLLTSQIERTKTATGLHLELTSADSAHIVRINNCLFRGLYQHQGNANPLGAVTLTNTWDSAQVKVTVTGSRFELNERALDMSVKGDIDVILEQSDFFWNFANGSGGAVRMTSHLESGLGALPAVRKAKLLVQNCNMSHNFAQTSSMYDATDDVYYQSRSPGSGGAIYVSLVVPSQLLKDGLVDIYNSTFTNNTADVQGGTLYVNPEISTLIEESTVSNTLLDWRPKFGDMIYATCNMTVRNTTLNVATTDGTTPLFSYQASDDANYRLMMENLYFECPVGHWIEQLNTTSFSRVGGSGLGTMQIYCRGCQDDEYSLNISRATFLHQQDGIENSVICAQCPYGAECEQGILNTEGFWGIKQRVAGLVHMYQCPEEYCEQQDGERVYYDGCAENRAGTLCGRCADGYSESLFGTACIPNEDCGMQNWWVAVFLATYGILYALFFMFEGDWENFISWLSIKMKRGKKEKKSAGSDKGEADNETEETNDEKDEKSPSATDKKGSKADKEDEEKEDEIDNADMGKSGYFQIFMYFIQTASLLKVKIVVVEDDIYKEVHRPQDILPRFMIDGIEELLSFNINFLEGRTCLFENLTVVSKTYLKLIFVAYLFLFIISLYVFTMGCCVFLPYNRRPRLGPISNSVRILVTILSLFLYTYQSVAEDAFLLLNCISVDGENVLFYDGNVVCLQEWQYAIIVLVTVFVIPFFTILLFGPKLLDQRRIGIIFFMCACVFPLFLSVPIILMYFDVICKVKPDDVPAANNNSNTVKAGAAASSVALTNDASQPLTPPRYSDQPVQRATGDDGAHSDDDDADETNCCCGDVREIRDEIVDLLSGPYRTDIFNGICYEGVLNFRRMIMVVLFTFITDILLRQMALACACFVILLVHIRAKPFRQAYSNYVESFALCLLLIISGTNMVKAAFYHSQTVPRGSNYLVIVIYEWIEALCLGVLPLVIIVAIVLAMVVKTGSKAFMKTKKDDDDDDLAKRPDGVMHYYDYRGRHGGSGDYQPYGARYNGGYGSHDMSLLYNRRSPMPNTRWRPQSPNIYRQSQTSTLDPGGFTHALRYPSFDDTSDDGSRSSPRHLPRTPTQTRSRRKLRRTNPESGESPAAKRKPSTGVNTISDVLDRLPRGNLVPRISDTPWATDDASLYVSPKKTGLPRSDGSSKRSSAKRGGGGLPRSSIDASSGGKHSQGLPRSEVPTVASGLPRIDTPPSGLPRRDASPNRLPRSVSPKGLQRNVSPNGLPRSVSPNGLPLSVSPSGGLPRNVSSSGLPRTDTPPSGLPRSDATLSHTQPLSVHSLHPMDRAAGGSSSRLKLPRASLDYDTLPPVRDASPLPNDARHGDLPRSAASSSTASLESVEESLPAVNNRRLPRSS